MEKAFELIAHEYELGTIKEVNRIAEGVLNENYLLTTTKGAYFIKGLRGKTAERLSYIHRSEQFMKEFGIPAIAMITRNNGEISLKVQEIEYSVYPYVESDRSHKYSNADYVRMGNMLGNIHKASFGKDVDEASYRKLWGRRDDEILQKLHGYKKLIESKDALSNLDAEFLEYINLKLQLAEMFQKVPDLPNDTLIHGDYHAGNLLIDKDTREIIGICDWEKSEYAPRAYEIVRTMMYVGFDSDILNTDHSFEIARCVVEGYRSVLDVSTAEIIAGFKMRLNRHVITSWIENMYYGEGNSRANHFIKNEMAILKLFVAGDGIKRLESIL